MIESSSIYQSISNYTYLYIYQNCSIEIYLCIQVLWMALICIQRWGSNSVSLGIVEFTNFITLNESVGICENPINLKIISIRQRRDNSTLHKTVDLERHHWLAFTVIPRHYVYIISVWYFRFHSIKICSSCVSDIVVLFKRLIICLFNLGRDSF